MDGINRHSVKMKGYEEDISSTNGVAHQNPNPSESNATKVIDNNPFLQTMDKTTVKPDRPTWRSSNTFKLSELSQRAQHFENNKAFDNVSYPVSQESEYDEAKPDHSSWRSSRSFRFSKSSQRAQHFGNSSTFGDIKTNKFTLGNRTTKAMENYPASQNIKYVSAKSDRNSWKNSRNFKFYESSQRAQHFGQGKTFDLSYRTSQKVMKNTQDVQSEHTGSRTDPFTYLHTQRLLRKYQFCRIASDVYQYDSNLGYYKSLNENQLETLVRRGWNKDTQIRLTRFNMIDILNRLKSEPEIEVDEDYFDMYEKYVNFINGTFDISTGSFGEHSSSFRQTSVLNAEYTPTLSLDGTRFKNFIEFICEDDPVKINHLQEILGFIFSNFIHVKKAVVFDGVRDSGKSTLLRTIERIIGHENASHFSLSELSRRFVTGKLLNKKINICGERGTGMIKDIETFKMITGGDWCESENKGRDFVSKPAKTKLVFAGNSLPQFENEDDNSAFMDRTTLFIFKNSISLDRQNIAMDEQLYQERNTIASWAMQGLLRLAHNNFVFKEAKDAEIIHWSRSIQMDPIDNFLIDNCTMELGTKVFSANLFSAYVLYCRENALDSFSQRQFISTVIAKTEGRNVIHKKLRIGNSKPLLGFENMGLKYESNSTEQAEQRNDI